MVDGAQLQLLANMAIEYTATGKVVVTKPVTATVSAGATLGHLGIAEVKFPNGAVNVTAPTPGSATRPADGTIKLSTAAAGNPEQSITLVEAIAVEVSGGRGDRLPGRAGPIAADVETTAARRRRSSCPAAAM